MMIRIAVIGTDKMVRKVIELNHHANVQISSFIYEKPEESARLVEAASGHDVLFFTGPLPYALAREEVEKREIPAVYIPLDELVLTVSLFHIKHSLFVHPDRLSIDIPQKAVVHGIFDELDLDMATIKIKELGSETGERFDTEEIIAFHTKNWRAGEIDFVLTCVHSVQTELQKLGIPSFRMIIPQKNILDTLERAVAIGELLVTQASQIAVGIVRIAERDSSDAAPDPSLAAPLYDALDNFAQKMNATIKSVDEHTWMIYGTKGGIRQMTNDYNEFPLLRELDETDRFTLQFGFGFGITVTEAEEHAQIGLYHAQKAGSHAAYIVTEHKRVIGPLNSPLTRRFQLQSQDDHLLAIAKQTGISVATLSKVLDFVNLRRNHLFSAADLADYLQLSKRSAERLLKKLLECRYAEISGGEQPYQKGRPRALYKVHI